MQGQLFQLMDSDGGQCGIIWTDLEGVRDIDKHWIEYYNNSEDDDIGPDGFVEFLEKKYPHAAFERVYTDEIYPF